MNGLLVIDNFLDDPYMVRNYALSIDYFSNNIKDSTFPGKRSSVIAEINTQYNLYIFNKITKLIYNISESSYSIDMKSYFQIVNSKYSRGWVHSDEDQIAGVLYLNPTAPINSGTGFYSLKQTNSKEELEFDTAIKKQFVMGNISYEEAKKSLDRHNLQYQLDDYVSNKYNRLVLYPGNWLHCAGEYFGDDDDKNARLTQVFFINCINHNADQKYFLDKIRVTK
jgi:hypothetical protein